MHFEQKKRKNTRGLSTIVATLLIILLVLVAVGIIWIVIKNVLSSGSEQVYLGKFTLDLDIISISRDANANSMDVTVKRNAGKGELFGLAFIAEDQSGTELIKLNNITLNQLEERTFRDINLSPVINVSRLQTVSIAPIFKLESGKEVVGDIVDIYVFSVGLESKEIICNDTCASLDYTCGTHNICGNATDCGICTTAGYSCNTSGQCSLSCTDTCASLGYTCGTYSICGVSTTCWGCSDGEICNKTTCTSCQGAGCISSCGTLSSGGTNFLTSNVTSVGNCLIIAASNVVLDCQNRWITYSTGGEEYTNGITATQFNTTIKNCNILDGNWNSGTGSFRIGIDFATNDNSTLFNNFINTSNSPGIYFNQGATFNNVTRNRAVSNSGVGIYLFSDSDNNVLIDNTAISDTNVGIIVTNSSGNNLIGNNGTSNSNPGIFLTLTSDNKLTNNIGISDSNIGIFLSESSRNILTKNNGTSNSNPGIFLVSSPYNLLINNIAKGSTGMIIYSSYNTAMINNTAESNNIGTLNYGTFVSLSSNVTLINHESTSHGTDSSDYGLAITGSNNSIFRDSIFNGGGGTDVAYLADAGAINNTFINCAYDTESVIGTGNELIRKWYYRAYVNNSAGSAVSAAIVTAYNNLNVLQFTKSTNSLGWINTQELTDYINTGGVKTSYSSYTINATKSGSTSTKTYTISSNKLNEFFTLS